MRLDHYFLLPNVERSVSNFRVCGSNEAGVALSRQGRSLLNNYATGAVEASAPRSGSEARETAPEW